jgi:hypothetical protein
VVYERSIKQCGHFYNCYLKKRLPVAASYN